MPTSIAPKIQTLQAKSHNQPDELRSPDKTRVEVVHLEGYVIARLTFQPGWRWSQCIKPVAKTDMCELSHVGYAVSGRLVVKVGNGPEMRILPGMSYAIPPGHDAFVEGDEPFVGLELLSAEQYAKR